jgi:hypothetical protein
MIKTHIKNVRGLTKKDQTFASALSTDFHPDGNSLGKHMENSGKQNPKMGFKPPRAEILAFK